MACAFVCTFFVLGIVGAILVLSQAEEEPKVELNPDNEDDSSVPTYTSASLQNFLINLEQRSGLAKENYTLSVDITNCGSNVKCIVNYRGDLIWEARNKLYERFLMQSYENEDDKKITLDGCLNYSTSVADYQTCMKQVRELMIKYLDDSFDTYIQKKINGNCTLFEENCNAQSS